MGQCDSKCNIIESNRVQRYEQYLAKLIFVQERKAGVASLRKKVLIIAGTRPEIIKLIPVYRSLKSDSRFEPLWCATGQQINLSELSYSEFSLTPDFSFNVMTKNQSLSDVFSKMTLVIQEAIAASHPDYVLVQGDTNTALAGAIAAFLQQIPVGHVEAGLRSGNRSNPFPEEINRRLISQIASNNFAPNQAAVSNLLREGINRDSIYCVGNTGIDQLLFTKENDPLLSKEQNENAGSSFKIFLTCHRRESFGLPLLNIVHAIKEIVRRNSKVVFTIPVHPNPNVKNILYHELARNSQIKLIEPLSYSDTLRHIHDSNLVITDSGGIQEEAPYLEKFVFIVRETTERSEGIDFGAAKLIGTDPSRIIDEVERFIKHRTVVLKGFTGYGDGNASSKICNLIATELRIQ
jgi:UDP-N-acetylglucosamine 2-epimerase (non-hydrolysing)